MPQSTSRAPARFKNPRQRMDFVGRLLWIASTIEPRPIRGTGDRPIDDTDKHGQFGNLAALREEGGGSNSLISWRRAWTEPRK
jgi:hypothetical protein